MRSDCAKKVADDTTLQSLSDNLELAAQVMDEGEFGLINEAVREHRERKARESRAHGTRSSRIGLVTAYRGDTIPIEVARPYMPCKGRLVKDTTLHWRWTAKYERTGQHFSTKSWGGETDMTEGQALSFVLKQVWSWFTIETEIQCPYDLDEIE